MLAAKRFRRVCPVCGKVLNIVHGDSGVEIIQCCECKSHGTSKLFTEPDGERTLVVRMKLKSKRKQ